MLEVITAVLLVSITIVAVIILNRAIDNLKRQMEGLVYAINSGEIYVVKVDENGLIREASDCFSSATQISKEVLCGMSLSDLVAEDWKEEYENILLSLKTKTAVRSELMLKIPTGFPKEGFSFGIDFNITAAGSYVNGLAEYWFVGRNVKLSVRAGSQSIVMEAAKEFILNSANIGAWEFDVLTQADVFSERCWSLLNLQQKSGITPMDYLMNNADINEYADVIEDILKHFNSMEESFFRPLRIMGRGGNPDDYQAIELFGKYYFSEEGKVLQVAGSMHDVTESVKNEEEIKYLAFYDQLTGLYNRNYFELHVDEFLQENPKCGAILIYIDIDDFKNINEAFGHSFGDNIIKELAKRLAQVAEGYTLCRFSGDEMAVFIPYYTTIQGGAKSLIKNISKALSIHYSEEYTTYRISVSMGVSIYPFHGKTFGDLLKFADIALSVAKSTGKDKFVFFDKKMNTHFQKRVILSKELKDALEKDDELVIYVQPQYDIESGNLCGVEVLSRWNHPKHGLISPSEFIPIAEETRLIIPLGKKIIKGACKILKDLKVMGHENIKVSCNVSPVQMYDETLAESIGQAVYEYDINPELLELEITESVLMDNFSKNVEMLRQLKDQGITIALDDFGTGYSSFKYLQTLPISTLKIDKSFIDNIFEFKTDEKITEQIIKLSHILNLTTVAEGVESIDQLNILKSINCDVVQGFLSGRPIPAENIYEMLDRRLMGES